MQASTSSHGGIPIPRVTRREDNSIGRPCGPDVLNGPCNGSEPPLDCSGLDNPPGPCLDSSIHTAVVSSGNSHSEPSIHQRLGISSGPSEPSGLQQRAC